MSGKKYSQIARTCAEWYRMNGRSYPWRQSTDLYRVFVAEFLLRKTQVYRVLPVYTALVAQYPSFLDLAQARPEDVCGLTAPLGLPKRGLQMIEVARRLLEEGSGVESGDALLKFEGVGKYIANAVECLSFNRPAPLVDGAVGRLLRRVYGLNSERPAYADNGLWELAARIVASRTSSCREVSLGMIDISATFCKKHTPLCLECPLSELCKYPD